MHACILPSDPHTYTQVIGDEFDQWVEEHALPLPPVTLGRYEAARQKRLDLFKKDVVARHWRQRFDMAHTHTHTLARARTHTHTLTRTHAHPYMHVYVHVVARHWRQRLDMAHTHTRSRTHTHTHTYMYMYMW